MRKVLSVSLPDKTARQIKKISKLRGFDSVSGYIKYLIDADQDIITEDELYDAAVNARNDYKNKDVIEANSIADLL